MLGETGGVTLDEVEYNTLGENECDKFGGTEGDTLIETEVMFSRTVLLTPDLITYQSFKLYNKVFVC
jgi:hypothetical protein